MIKVLYISNEDRNIGGSSVSLKAMLESLRGEVDPVILFREEGPACDYFRKDGYNCTVIPFRRATFHASGIERILRFLPHAATTAIVQARCIRRARKLFSNIDLVHSNSGTIDIGLRIAAVLRVPHVWHIREYLDLGLHARPFLGWGHWQRNIVRSDAVIAISKGLFDHLHLEGHRSGHCIPDAVCRAEDAILIRKKEPCIVFLAGIVSELKRPDEAVRIFAKAGLPDHRLKIVGSLPEGMESKLEAVAGESGIADRIDYIPFTENIKELLSQVAALLVCTEYEGLGRVSIEAMFYGCPVIARNSGGSADVLDGGRYGQLYTSIDEGAGMLREAVQNPPYEQLEQAMLEAIKTYSIENYGNKILKLYHSLP